MKSIDWEIATNTLINSSIVSFSILFSIAFLNENVERNVDTINRKMDKYTVG